MGGYGALRLGLAMPERFAAVASLSGALDIVKRAREAGRQGSRVSLDEWIGILGPRLKVEGTDADLRFLAQKIAASDTPKPELYLACGSEDELLEDSRAFRRHLDTLHLPATYAEGPGTHEWGYWDAQIQRVLDWLPISQGGH
jgi:S-formylglutathione hydrolase FrmB